MHAVLWLLEKCSSLVLGLVSSLFAPSPSHKSLPLIISFSIKGMGNTLWYISSFVVTIEHETLFWGIRFSVLKCCGMNLLHT